MSQSPANSKLILPGNPEFYRILATPPPEPDKTKNFVVRSDSLILEAAGEKELDDYLEGGEYDLRMADIDDIESEILYLPDSMSY